MDASVDISNKLIFDDSPKRGSPKRIFVTFKKSELIILIDISGFINYFDILEI